MATDTQRHELAAVMDYLVQHRAKVHYPAHDVRVEQIHTVSTLVGLHRLVDRPSGLTIDCSQSVTLMFHVAGLNDPNGHFYRDDGFTGTLLEGPCPHYFSARNANVGAIVVFGGGTGHHVCVVREPDPLHGDPLLFSHGQEADPVLIRLSQESRWQPAPVTFLSIASL